MLQCDDQGREGIIKAECARMDGQRADCCSRLYLSNCVQVGYASLAWRLAHIA